MIMISFVSLLSNFPPRREILLLKSPIVPPMPVPSTLIASAGFHSF